MDEDLNAAMALGFVFDRMRELNRALDAGDRPTVTAARNDLLRAGATLGLFAETPAALLEQARRRGQQRAGLTDAEIEAAIAEREAARKRKDFRAADAVRERLRERGILLEDTPSGTLWRAG
jgi:cysteinyl-tRNA synthetase